MAVALMVSKLNSVLKSRDIHLNRDFFHARRLFPDLNGVAAEMRRYYSASATQAIPLD